MNSQTLFEKYRKHFSRAMALTLAVVSVLELVVYAIFVQVGMCALSLTDFYLLTGVLLPIGLNFAIYMAVTAANRSAKIPDETKNNILMYGISAVAFVIAVIHRQFMVTACACLFPMMLSAAFNNKKLISGTFLISLFTCTVVVILSALERALDLTDQISYIIMYGFVIVGYLSCSLSMQYTQLYLRLVKQQARDNAQLQDILLQDSMTGLYNHRTFHVELQAAIDRNADFCLAMIDIDHFKQINDRHGHDGGDEVLHKLATILKQLCQTQDKAFRYGGEEFAVIFGGKTLEESLQLLQKMHDAFSEAEYATVEEKITFSAGLASYRSGESKMTFFDRADDLLYAAKENGRNQIRTDAETPVSV